jgi:hypothetical protein
MGLFRLRGAAVVNIDAVIVAEEPKMGPHIPAMKAALSPVLGIPETSLGIKAKTNEGLGAVGEKRAIACYAVALVKLPIDSSAGRGGSRSSSSGIRPATFGVFLPSAARRPGEPCSAGSGSGADLQNHGCTSRDSGEYLRRVSPRDLSSAPRSLRRASDGRS